MARHCRLLVMAAAISGTIMLGAPAEAKISDGIVTGGAGTVDGTPTVVLVQGGGGSTVASVPVGGSGSAWTCTYTNAAVVFDSSLKGPTTPEAGHIYLFRCWENGVPVHFEVLRYDPANPAGGAFAAQRAAAIAAAQLPLPDPQVGTNPGDGNPALVGLPTWLWVDNYGPIQASATLGGVTATVTATPTGVTFDTGDGGSVSCADGGTPYDPAMPAESQASDCVHTWTERSTVDDPAGTRSLRAQIDYEITWSATNGQSGTLDTQTRSSLTPVQIVEAQALLR